MVLRCCSRRRGGRHRTCRQQLSLLVRTHQKHVSHQQPRVIMVVAVAAGGKLVRFATQRSPSLRNRPLGIAVPGLICAGSSNHRTINRVSNVQPRAGSLAQSPSHHATGRRDVTLQTRRSEVNNCRASTRSCAVNGSIGSLMYGSCWPDIATKNRTRICSRLARS